MKSDNNSLASVIEQFVEKDSIEALHTLITTESTDLTIKSAIKVANSFNGQGHNFEKIANKEAGFEEKLILSFHNNLVLLIQKTWVEKSDEELKAQVLYHLEEFTRQITDKAYNDAYNSFLEIVDTVVYLMFGVQSKTKDFDNYALRIDPEFGIFWWYFTSLPKESIWNEEKNRVAVLLGMYFLANY